MLSKITMPSGGTNTDQLLVVSWKKKAGDAVKRGDILLEVETDKALLEVESFAQGTLLKRLVEEGSYGTVGDVIAYIGNPEDLTALETGSAPSKPAAADLEVITPAEPTTLATVVSESETAPPAQADSSNRTVKATPAAKKEARDRGLDLAEVHRSVGKEILRRSDVVQFSGVSAGSPDSSRATGDVTGFTLVPLTTMRRIIAERMEAGSSVPTFTAEIEVDMTGLIRLRSDLSEHFKGIKFGYNDIIAKCVAIAAGDYPLVNASFTDQGIRVFRSVNIGLAVSLEQGLAVPVVCDVRGKDIASLAEANAANIAQVRTGKFDPKILENGTLTISNIGKYPITRFTAILNPPQSCILAVSAIQSRGVWVNGQLREQPTAAINGTFDHRVIDGRYGAEFLTGLKELLEHPALIFIR
jgi:pyruvate dehydrogenase E2 component (dihydrolipoyllysine-residue acetyltransferase)